MNFSERRRLRVVLRDLYRAALVGVDPKRSTPSALMLPAVASFLASGRRLGIFAVGKAAAGMLEGAPRADRTLVILPKGTLVEGVAVRASGTHPRGVLVEAVRRGTATARAGNWSGPLRVSERRYAGLADYRYLEDEDDE